jgi:hypothetical protein
MIPTATVMASAKDRPDEAKGIDVVDDDVVVDGDVAALLER